MTLDPAPFLQAFSEPDARRKVERENLQKIQDYENRTLAFDWIHSGRLSMKIRELSEIIKNSPILPPRTGHLGNWQEIAAGRGNALDHNGVVCGRNLAYPLIVDFNQTENSSMDSGDVVYLPGSIVNNGERQLLDIYTWNGTAFEARSREFSYFLPFVLTRRQGKFIPLTVIQRKNCLSYENAKFISSIIFGQLELVKEVLRKVIEYVRADSSGNLTLNDLVDRSVSIEGKLIRTELKFSAGKYQSDDMLYSSIDELVDALILPFKAAHDPQGFFDQINHMPKWMPFLSLPFLCTLYSILNTHLLHQAENHMISRKPFNPYLEWGAFDSAGYPPKSAGYFKKKASTIKEIYRIVIHLFPDIEPLLFILLPSAIFNLLPGKTYPDDISSVEELLSDILHETTGIKSSAADLMLGKIELVTRSWLKDKKSKLSSYYLNKFSSKRCIHLEKPLIASNPVVDLSQFNELSLQQACMTLGSLREIISQQEHL